MRSNAHIPLPLWGILQTCNVRGSSRIWRYVFTGAQPVQTTLYALHWLSAALLQWLKSVRAHQTSLGQLLGAGTQLAQAALGVLQSVLAGIKSPIHALLHRLHVVHQAKLKPYLARVGT
jgi:hypothetical protein